MTPENLRHHAAGHLAAAHALALAHPEAAREVLMIVEQFVHSPSVSSPPQLKEKLSHAIEDPGARKGDIQILESWFVDPLNTVIEKAGGAFGG